MYYRNVIATMKVMSKLKMLPHYLNLLGMTIKKQTARTLLLTGVMRPTGRVVTSDPVGICTPRFSPLALCKHANNAQYDVQLYSWSKLVTVCFTLHSSFNLHCVPIKNATSSTIS